MPPRGRKKATTRRPKKFKGLNVTQAGIAYANLAIWSKALTGTNPVQFLMDKGGAGASMKITLREVWDSIQGGTGGVYGPTAKSAKIGQDAFSVIQYNAKQNALPAIGATIALGVGSAVALKVTRKSRNALNRNLRDLGVGDFIKF